MNFMEKSLSSKSIKKIGAFTLSCIFIILLFFELQILLIKLNSLSLENVKQTPLPKYDFADPAIPGFRLTTIFLMVTSILGWIYFTAKFLQTLERRITSAIILFLAATLSITAIIASFNHYWITGFVIALILQSLATQSLMARELILRVVYSRKSFLKKAYKFSTDQITNLSIGKTLGPISFVAITYLTVFYPTRKFQLWDYVGQEGRFAMQNAFIFSEFPLRSLSLPGESLTYHWGFDGLTAGLSTTLNIPLDVSNFMFTVALFFLLYVAIDQVCSVYFPKNHFARISISTMVIFGGGLPFYYGTESFADSYSYLFPMIDWKGIYILPPSISYFYQKSFAISLPLMFLFIRILIELTNKGSKRKYLGAFGLCVVLLTGLAISSGTLFITGTLTFIICLTIDAFQNRSFRSTLPMSFGACFLLGLFFAYFAGFSNLLLKEANKSSQGNFSIGLYGTHESASTFLVWLFVSSVPLALFTFRRFVAFSTNKQLLILPFLGLLIYFFVEFRGSVDMIKFMVLPRMILVLLVGIVLLQFILNVKIIFWRVFWVFASAILVATPGLIFLKPLLSDSFRVEHQFDGYTRTPEGPSAVVSYSKRLGGANNFICSPELVNYCGVYGGLTQLNPDILVKVQALSPEQQALQYELLIKPGNPEEYRRLGFYYLIVGPESGEWKRKAIEWASLGEAREVYQNAGYSLLSLEIRE